jgi:glycosyltransferase involved in cell wall biosynthesis
VSRVVALVPARDEADIIEATVAAVSGLAEEVIVIDDASSDGTGAVAAGAGANTIICPRRLGKGGALEVALGSVDEEADLWILADADLGDSASELSLLLAEVRSGRCDIAIATLPPQGGGFGFVKRAAAFAIRVLGGIRVTQPLSGQRVLTAEALAACRPLARGFGVETAMTIDAARLGLRVLEVPTGIRHRAGGRDLSGFRHRGRQGWDILRAVAGRAVLR